MPPNSVGRLSSLAAIRELTAAVENSLVWGPPINKRRAHNVLFKTLSPSPASNGDVGRDPPQKLALCSDEILVIERQPKPHVRTFIAAEHPSQLRWG